MTYLFFSSFPGQYLFAYMRKYSFKMTVNTNPRNKQREPMTVLILKKIDMKTLYVTTTFHKAVRTKLLTILTCSYSIIILLYNTISDYRKSILGQSF